MGINRYKKYIMPYIGAFILGPVLMLTEVAGEIMLPKMMSLIINNGVAQRDIRYITMIGIAMAGVIVVMALGGILGAYFSAKASISFTRDLRQDLFAKVQQFSFKNIDEFSTGSLVTRLTNDIQQIQNVLMMSLRLLFRAPGMLVGALIMAFSMNARLARVILVMIPVLALTIFVIMRIAFPRFKWMQKALDRLNSSIQEALVNVRVIKSFVREEDEHDKFREKNKALKDISLKAMNVVIITMPVMMLAMNITTLFVVWYGGNLVINREMPIGNLTAFTTYIVQILMSLMMLAMVLLQSSRAMVSLTRINEVMDKEIDLTDDQAQHKDRQISRGQVEFEQVSFAYSQDGGAPVLENISFTARPGQTIGIIGSTGSGKTSLVQLIPRLYDVSAGAVKIDGIDVRDYGLKNLREGVAMVLQKNVLFSGTIAENLRWGDEDAAMEELVSAAESAQADEFIRSFPDGYNAEIDQGGVNVSGGQKQRLCIARALLKKPKIIIFDDSTSAVDTATEARIQEHFATTLKAATKFIIAQRIGSVEKADQIVVLDEGRIVGSGTHHELIVNCEAYREIYYSQIDKEVG